MELPKKERTFYFKHDGELGFVYEGHFTIKCRLNVAERYSLELEKSRLLADMANPTNGLLGTAVALSTLRTKIVDGPNWWKQGQGLMVEDEDTLFSLYEEVEKESQKWRKDLESAAKAKDTKEDQSGEQKGN